MAATNIMSSKKPLLIGLVGKAGSGNGRLVAFYLATAKHDDRLPRVGETNIRLERAERLHPCAHAYACRAQRKDCR